MTTKHVVADEQCLRGLRGDCCSLIVFALAVAAVTWFFGWLVDKGPETAVPRYIVTVMAAIVIGLPILVCSACLVSSKILRWVFKKHIQHWRAEKAAEMIEEYVECLKK